MNKYKCGEFVKLPRDGLEEYFSGFEKKLYPNSHIVFHTEAKIIKKKRTHHHHS